MELQRAAKRSPIPIWEAKGNPRVDFLMVIMASGIAHGHVCMTTTESRNRHAALVYCVHGSLILIGQLCYDQMTPVKIRYPLTHVTRPYCGLKFVAHRDHVFF